MIKLKFNIILALLIGFGTTGYTNSSLPFKKEVKRIVQESFDVGQGSLLSIQNKYGDINISTWDKNQVEFIVTITAKCSSEEKAEEFLNAVNIDFVSSSRGVSAKTIYPDQNNSGSWWSSWWGNSKNIEYETKYEVKVPARIDVDLIDKYGDISMASIDGKANIENKYGDIAAQNISGDVVLNLGYGKAFFGNAANVIVEMKYSRLNMDVIQNLDIESKYSKIRITGAQNLKSETKYDVYKIGNLNNFSNSGKYDDFTIDQVNDIYLDTKYTDFNVSKMTGNADFETGFGDVDVSEVSGSVNSIAISARYTNYDFGIDQDFTIDLEGSYTSFKSTMDVQKDRYIHDGSDLEVYGYHGSKGGLSIKAEMDYGGLYLK